MVELPPQDGISEINFGYHSESRVYTNSSSDITKLYDMLLGVRDKDEEQTISYLG